MYKIFTKDYPYNQGASLVAQILKICLECGRLGFHCLEKEMATHYSILAHRFYGQRSLVNYCSWGCKDSDITERLTPLQSKLCMEGKEAEMCIARILTVINMSNCM